MNRLISALLTLSFSAFSQPFSFLSGSEADTKGQSYSYIGFIAEKSVSSNTSILGKVWGDYLIYKFEQGNVNVRAEAPAFQVSGGVKRRYDVWSISLWAGWERRDTKVSPEVPGIEVKGIKDSLVLQLELFGKLGRNFSTSFITSFSSATSYLWSRARLKRSVLGGRFHLGAELIGQGNKDYRAVQSGVLLETSLGRAALGVRGGYKNSSKGDSPYAGVELYIGF